MGDPSEPAITVSLIAEALKKYEQQTGANLANESFTLILQGCDTVECINAAFEKQAKDFLAFKGEEGKVIKHVKQFVVFLDSLSKAIDHKVPLSPAKIVLAAMGHLLGTVTDVSTYHDAIADLFEPFEHFLRRLDSYVRFPLFPAMKDLIVKIFVELLATLAHATDAIKEKKWLKFLKFETKIFGKTDLGAILKRLDRLTDDELRITAARTLEIVHDLAGSMKAILGASGDTDGGLKTWSDSVQNGLVALQKMASEMNASKRQQLRTWLDPPRPSEEYNNGCEILLRGADGTATWFTKGDTFARWKISGSLLWIQGKPGSGKTVLCSAIIQDLEEMSNLGFAFMTYFYFKDDKKRTRRSLLSSILAQLCYQSDIYYKILSEVHAEHQDGGRSPSYNVLKECLVKMIEAPRQAPIFIIIDAIDECQSTIDTPSARKDVLDLVKELIDLRCQHLRICITGHPEPDIRSSLYLIACSVSLHDEEGQKKDIFDYIAHVVNRQDDNEWTDDDKEFAIETLSQRADGMFQWVSYQFNYILECFGHDLQRALYNLPATLDDTYRRALAGISAPRWTHAHRLFQCVAVSYRPLLVEELAGFLAFDFNAGYPRPKFLSDRRPQHPERAVLSTTTSLLVVVPEGNSRPIQFCHHSVKDFLTSQRIANDVPTVSRYQILEEPAHSIVAQTCLALLLELGRDINIGQIKAFPLARYAAQHWIDHARAARREGLSSIQNSMRQLLDWGEPQIAIWLWLCDVVLHYSLHAVSQNVTSLITNLDGFDAFRNITFPVIEHSRNFKTEPNPFYWASKHNLLDLAKVLLGHNANAKFVNARDDNHKTPLHWATQCGHLEIVQFLLDNGGDVGALDDYNTTPLHLASMNGYLGVVQLLLESGAKVNSQDDYQKTPLDWAEEGKFSLVVDILKEKEHCVDKS